jgi:DNA-directed RNA polymerase specialized sigma subunit
MNQQLQNFARQFLKDELKKLPGRPQEIFKLMYARDNGRRSVADALAMPINEVVDLMPDNCLDHAMKQVQRTLDNNVRN